jgi:hypothetical protein
MSTNALSQVYKTAILAIEECPCSATVAGIDDIAIGATSIYVNGKYITSTPFVAGDNRPYVIRDNSFFAGAPNQERFCIASITGASSVPLADGSGGYHYTATLNVLGYTSTGWNGGLVKGYKHADSPTILTPGVEVAIFNTGTNCRFKTLSDAPKIDFDDEASRIASGDEGRDNSIAGARSADINFTEKLAWAGSVSIAPTWATLMRTLGHIVMYRSATPVTMGSAYATLGSLLSYLINTVGIGPGCAFYTADGDDTASGALATAKGSALAIGDAFVINANNTITYKAIDDLGAVTGVEIMPLTHANEVTATIWMFSPENGASPSQTVYRYCGCHGGNGSSISGGKVGDPYMLTAKYSGAYIGTLELSLANARTLTGFETTVPEVMLNNQVTVPCVFGTPVVSPRLYATATTLISTYAFSTGARFYTADGSDTVNFALVIAKQSVLAGATLVKGDAFIVASPTTITYSAPSKELDISQFNLDFGGVVTAFLDQSTSTGNAYYKTDDRDPKLTINPYHVRKSLDDIDYAVTNMLTGKITVQSAASNPHITIEIANSQLLSPALASREGYVNTNRTYRALRNDLGAGASDLSLPAGCMYSILIGSRS